MCEMENDILPFYNFGIEYPIFIYITSLFESLGTNVTQSDGERNDTLRGLIGHANPSEENLVTYIE